MEKLVKPAEYAKEMGISRQAVYAKIKKGMLTVKDKEGKIYIVLDNEKEGTDTTIQGSKIPIVSQIRQETSARGVTESYQKLLAAKDETIAVLKSTVADLKESNHQMSTTLKGEIDLLKSAFSEMRSLYVHRIERLRYEQKQENEMMDIKARFSHQEEESQEWISLKKFLKSRKISDKQKEKLVKRFKKAFKSGDTRLSKIEGKLKLDKTKEYSDLFD